MNYSQDNYYYLVNGWYESNNGLYQKSFYGAVSEPSDYLTPKRCVLHGEDAQKASDFAATQHCRVCPEEFTESHDRENPPDRPDYLDKKTELTPKEKDRTKHMLLDKDGNDAEDEPKYKCPGCGQMVAGGEKGSPCIACKSKNEWIDELKAEILSELSTGTGAIAMGPLDNILSNPSLNTARLGMSDRGGHGTEKNLGPKKLKPGKNFAKGHSSTLKGIGTSHRSNTTGASSGGTGSSGALPTISQASTGRRGGRG